MKERSLIEKARQWGKTAATGALATLLVACQPMDSTKSERGAPSDLATDYGRNIRRHLVLKELVQRSRPGCFVENLSAHVQDLALGKNPLQWAVVYMDAPELEDLQSMRANTELELSQISGNIADPTIPERTRATTMVVAYRNLSDVTRKEAMLMQNLHIRNAGLEDARCLSAAGASIVINYNLADLERRLALAPGPKVTGVNRP